MGKENKALTPMMDYEAGQPYVHRLWRDYKKRYKTANIEGMKKDALEVYKEQSRRLKNTFKANNNLTTEQTEKTLITIQEALDKILKNNNNLLDDPSAMNTFKKEEYQVDGKSFYAYSSNQSNREKLFNQGMSKLIEFIKKLDEAITAYEGVSETTREIIEKEARNISATNPIPTKAWAESFENIYGDGKADKGVKKLVASTLLLKKYAGLLDSKDAASLPNIKDKDAMEIVRGLSGSLNGLAGGFFEIALNDILNNAGAEFMREVIKMKNITFDKSTPVGDKQIPHKALGGKTVTSKTDLAVKATVNGLEAEFGLSLKTADLKKGKDSKKKTTVVHSGNLGHLIMRAGA